MKKATGPNSPTAKKDPLAQNRRADEIYSKKARHYRCANAFMFYVFRLFQTRHGLTAHTLTNKLSYGVESPHAISKINLNPTKNSTSARVSPQESRAVRRKGNRGGHPSAQGRRRPPSAPATGCSAEVQYENVLHVHFSFLSSPCSSIGLEVGSRAPQRMLLKTKSPLPVQAKCGKRFGEDHRISKVRMGKRTRSGAFASALCRKEEGWVPSRQIQGQ